MARQQYVRHHVIHDYHDHSQDLTGREFCESEHNSPSPDDGLNRTEALGSDLQYSKLETKSKFPIKLHALLSYAEMYGFADIISWKVHGRAFLIHSPKEFCMRIMPQFFNQSKITSFLRQLNLYGFLRITQGLDEGSYYHELFLRGKPFLARHMLRQKVKGTKVKGLPSPETEPNFYAMPYLPVLPELISSSSRSKFPRRSSFLRECSPSFTEFPYKNKAQDENGKHERGITIMPHECETSAALKPTPDQKKIDAAFSNEGSDVLLREGDVAYDSSFEFTFVGEEDSFMESLRHLPDDISAQSGLVDHSLGEDECSYSSTQGFSFHECEILLALAHTNE
jgi:hypothetical protein